MDKRISVGDVLVIGDVMDLVVTEPKKARTTRYVTTVRTEKAQPTTDATILVFRSIL